MKSEEKTMPGPNLGGRPRIGGENVRPNVVVGTTFTPEIYDKIIAFGNNNGMKDQEVVRLAVAKMLSQI